MTETQKAKAVRLLNELETFITGTLDEEIDFDIVNALNAAFSEVSHSLRDVELE